MIEWYNTPNESWAGRFESKIFLDDMGGNMLEVYLENSKFAGYAEKCIENLNSLPDSLIIQICVSLINSAEQDKADDSFELPKLNNAKDILNYCWFTAVYVNSPEDENVIKYVVEGEGDWGEVVGFVIENNKLVYTGVEYLENSK